MCTSLNFLLLLLLPAFSLPGFPTSFCSCWSRYSWRFVKAQSHFRRSLSKSLSWKGGKKPTLNIAPAKPRFPYCGWHISSTLLLILHPSRRQSRHIQILQLSAFYVKYFWLPPLQLFFCTTQLNKTSLYTVLCPQTSPKLTKHWSWKAQSSPLPLSVQQPHVRNPSLPCAIPLSPVMAFENEPFKRIFLKCSCPLENTSLSLRTFSSSSNVL